MLLIPPYPLNQATSMIVCKPSAVLWLCVSVYGRMGVSHSIPWLFCAHYLFLQCLDVLRGSQTSTTCFIAKMFPKKH